MSTAPQAGPSGIGQMRRTKNRWKNTKLEDLVRVWSYYYKDLQLNRDHPVPVYRRIVDEMVRRGFSASLEDVRGRIHNLAAKFRKEAARSHASGQPSNWPMFYQIQEFMNYEVPQMETDPKLRAPTYIVSSSGIVSTEPQYLDEERLEEDGESQKETLSDDKAMEVEHLEEERLEEERLEEEHLEEERLEEECLEEERLEEGRIEEGRLEEERLEDECLGQERLEEERLEEEGLEEERLEEERLEEERLEEEHLDRIKENEESDQSQDKDIVQNQSSSPQRPLLKELQEEIQQKQNKLQQQAKARQQQQQQKLPQRQLVPAQQHPRQTNQQPQQTNQQQPMLTQQQQLRPTQQQQKTVRQPILSTSQPHPPQQRQEQKQQHRPEQQQHQPHRQEQKQQQQPHPQAQRQEQKHQEREEQQQHQPHRQEQKQEHRPEQRQDQPHRKEQKQQHRQEEQQQQRQAQKQKRWQELKQQQQLHEQHQSSQQQRQLKLRRIQQKQQKVTTDDDTCGEETPSPPPTPPPPPLRTLKEQASESRTASRERSREPRQRLLQIKSNHRLETIDDYYAKLYCNNMLADVTLVVWHEGETITLPAHRVILCNHSPYFATIFEKVSPIVGLGAVVMILPTDIPLKVMELLLQFIYSGEASIPANMIDDVWRCAVQLKIRGFWSESRGESNEPLINRPEQQLDARLPSAAQAEDQSDRSRNSRRNSKKRGRSCSVQIEESSGQARKRARRHQPSPSPSRSPSPSDVDEFDKIEMTEVSSEVGFDLLRSDLDEDEEYAYDDDEEGVTDEDEDEDEDGDEDDGEDENHETNEEDVEQATGEEDEARSIDDDDDDEEEDSEESEEEEEDSDGDEDDEYEILAVDDNDVQEDEVGQTEKRENQGDEDEQEPKKGTAERNIAIEQPPDTLEIVQESVDEPNLSCAKPEADLTPPPSFPNSPQEVGCETQLEINGGVTKVVSNGYESNGVVSEQPKAAVGCQSNSATSRPPVVVTSVQPSSRVRIDSSVHQATQQRVAVTTTSATRGPLAVYRRRQYRSFTCKLCSLNFTMADNWLKHVEKTHARDTRKLNRIGLQVLDTTTKSFCCDLCQKCLTSEFDWVQHVICQHTELYPHYFAESFGVTPPE